MNKTLWALALTGAVGCGSQGPAGPEGPKGDKGDPGGTVAGVGAVQPGRAFIGRTVTVQIGGNNTHFAEGKVTLDFGDKNIKVSKITVASPTLITAELAIGPTNAQGIQTPSSWAKPGAHDVNVITEMDEVTEMVTAKAAFTVDTPVQLQALDGAGQPGGTLEQGGIGAINIVNLDYVHNPFSFTPGSIFSAPQPKLNATLADAGAIVMQGGSSIVLSALALVDVKAVKTPHFAAIGPSPLDATVPVTYVVPAGTEKASVMVKERAPVELPKGMGKMGTLAAKYSTALYKIPADAMAMGDQLVHLSFARPAGATIRPGVALLGESGKWMDDISVVGGSSFADTGGAWPYLGVVNGGKEMYAIVYDANLGGGARGYEFTVTAKTKAVNTPAMYMGSSNKDMPNMQIDLTKGPNYIKTASLKDINDVNYFVFQSGEGGRLHLITGPQNPATDETDVTINIFKDSCKGASILPEELDNDYYEATSFVSEKGKTYCIAIGVSTFADVGGPYTLLLSPNL